MKLEAWRIAKAKYSESAGEMLSGEGAYRAGGRWNSKAVPMVYLGSSLAQAAMELLVHLENGDVLNAYCKLCVSFRESLIEHIDVADLPKNWADPCMAPKVREIGDAWIQAGSSVILQVPSAAIAGETNYLLNPHHPDFGKLEIGSITPFKYDPRLQKAKSGKGG